MKRFLLLIISQLALCVISCNESSTGPDGDILWPMAVGNRWIGVQEYYDSRGNSLGTKRDTMSVVATREIDGEMWYEFEDGVLRINREDGVWARLPISSTSGYTNIIARYPATRGDTFRTERLKVITPSGPTDDTVLTWFSTLSVDSVFTVPAGTFTCHVYGTYTLYLWDPTSTTPGRGIGSWAYAPGVGPVQITGSLIGSGSPADTAMYTWRLAEAK